MIRRRWVHGVTAACMVAWSLSAGVPVSAASSGEPASHVDPATQPHWVQVKLLLKKGAYREALQELEMILAITPNDGVAQAYKMLCEKRLTEVSPFGRESRESLAMTEETLRREEDAKRREKTRQRTVHRQMEQEQQHWDAELKRLEKEEIKRRKMQPPPAKAVVPPTSRASPQPATTTLASPPQPAASSDASTASPPHAASPPAPASESPAPKIASAASSSQALNEEDEKESDAGRHPEVPSQAPQPPATAPSSSGPSSSTTTPVELQPITVQTQQPQPPKAPPQAPGVFPGAVEMFAEHMTVSTARQIAVAEGNVYIVFNDGLLTCDKVTLFTDTNDIYAQGQVFLRKGLSTFSGELIHYNLDNKKGRIFSGTAGAPPWYEHGQVIEHIAEGVMRVRHGYLTSCDLEPPHYRLESRDAIVYAKDKIARGRNVTLLVDKTPLIYLPWLTVADRQTPFFIVPGKRKPWEEFALMGYRYEWPQNQRGTLRWDWRRTFGWGFGIEHRFEGQGLGKGLIKLYYNQHGYSRQPDPKATLPKGATRERYRVLFRHKGKLLPDTSVVTDMQKYSDINFRKDFLYREEYVNDNVTDGYVSMVTSDPNFGARLLLQKRLNRFQTTTEEYPDLTVETRPGRVGTSQLFAESQTNLANYQTKNAHSEVDTDVVRIDMFQQLSYALNLLKPILMTPKAGVRQTYYNKDIQGGPERPDGNRNIISGQWNLGLDSSLKLFRIFPITTNALGLDIQWLRHVLTPSLAYTYVHRPTVSNSILNFATAKGPANTITFGLDNKLQTKRGTVGQSMSSVDLARLTTSVPYTFRGVGNKQGGRLGDFSFDLETFPWRWLRVESDWFVLSHFQPGSRDARIPRWNVDLVTVGGVGNPEATSAHKIQVPVSKEATGDSGQSRFGLPLLPQGQWYLGYGHRYSHNDKTEDVIQFDWRVSRKWEIGTFHRITWKEVSGDSKRFNLVREWQYRLVRDLHDWLAELIYHVDREYGEEVYFMLTLKAYPEMPIQMQTSYHQPKFGSQSSPFSPIRDQR